MSLAKVSIIKGGDPKAITRRALELIGAREAISSGDSVLIKPNCIVPKHPSTGVTTDARVVDGVIDFVKGCGASDIVVGEGGNPETDFAFEVTGIRGVADRQGVELLNLNKDRAVEVSIGTGLALKKVKIAKTVLESDCIINVPKLKIHHMAQVTLSIKNLMGVIIGDRGKIMHFKLDEKLVDLANLIRPKLNVIDGIVGSEMDETMGRPVPMDLVIAGMDMVAVDAVGSAVMGVDPSKVGHIQLAGRRGLGVSALKKIDVLGEPIGAVRREFSREFSEEKLKSYGLQYPLSSEDMRNMKRKFEGRRG